MADTIMNLEPITLPGIENKRPLVIAGPCSAETEDQVLETAKELAAQGIKIFRAGIWKHIGLPFSGLTPAHSTK